MNENKFQRNLIKELQTKYPEAIVTKVEPVSIQGIPDLLILYKDKWAMLECKKDDKASKKPRPNQEYYVNKLNDMSFASFIYPENKEDVLNELEDTFADS